MFHVSCFVWQRNYDGTFYQLESLEMEKILRQKVDGMFRIHVGDTITSYTVWTPQGDGIKWMNRSRAHIKLSAVIKSIGLISNNETTG